MAGTRIHTDQSGFYLTYVAAARTRRHLHAVPLKVRVLLHTPGIRLVNLVIRKQERSEGNSSGIEVPGRDGITVIQLPQFLVKQHSVTDFQISEITFFAVFREKDGVICIKHIRPAVVVHSICLLLRPFGGRFGDLTAYLIEIVPCPGM